MQACARVRRSRVALPSELSNLQNSARQLQNASALPDVAVVVISHQIDTSGDSEAVAIRAKIWMDMQSELAGRAPQGTHVISAAKDHYVHLTQPQLVIDTIRQITERSRRICELQIAVAGRFRQGMITKQ